MVPFVTYAIWNGDFVRGAALIFVAGVTDALDGWLARHFEWTSRLGAYLDPIADKLLLVSSYVALGFQGSVPAWLVWLILGRDALILTMVAIALLMTNVRAFPPTSLGKLSTIVQVFAAVAIVTGHAYAGNRFHEFETFLIYVTALVTAGSGLHYAWYGISAFPAARRVAVK